MNENSEKLNFISNKSIHFKHLTPLPIRNDSLLTSLRNSVKFRSQDIIENSDQTIPLPANNNRRRSTIAHGKIEDVDLKNYLNVKDSSPSSFEKKVISRNRVRSDRSHSRRTSIMVDQSGIGILLNYDKEQSILKLTLNRFTIINKIGEQENENIANLKYYIKIKTDHSSIEHCSKLYDLKKTCLKWFKEDFLFSVPEGDYTKDYIYFRVFTHSPLYYDEFIAECDIPIKMVKLGESILLPLYKTVCNKASISIAFKYLQLSHRLNVLIMEGRNFDGINISSKSKMVLFLNIRETVDKKIKRHGKKSKTVYFDNKPIWNQSFSFDITSQDLVNVNFEVIVKEYKLISSYKQFGRIYIDNTSDQWKNLIQDDTTKACWHTIY